MTRLKDWFKNIKKTHLEIAGVLLMIILAVSLLLFNIITSMQAESALLAQVYFEGEYRIGDGQWQKIVEGEHIPSTKGDVTLRGNFHMLDPFGEYVDIYRDEIPIAFYLNHINLTVCEVGVEPLNFEMENPLYGSSACGEDWVAYLLVSDSKDMVELLIHNPHSYGNENAIDEMISNVSLWSSIEFEKNVLHSGETQRSVAIVFMIVSLMLLGIALFSTLIHIRNTKIIWILGLVVFFAGGYFAYSADGVSLWSESIVLNTTLLGVSMMFYMMFLLMSIVHFLGEAKIVGNIAVVALALTNAVFLILPIVSDVLFYDCWIWWGIAQIIANVVIAGCLIKEFVAMRGKRRWLCMGAILPLISFAVDFAATWIGVWEGGITSQCVFIVLFVVAMIMVLMLIPGNINAATKAKELEFEKTALNAQLADSRISTMMSQIRPHFIYNTLGSIEQLCKLDPPKAGELVHNFAKYLRGNFGELDNPKPILMSQEMEHVHHYISIENVRFPDMTFAFEMNSSDFKIPALTVQPIVENAIKHGLMKLTKGGTIRVVSFETDTHYYITVEDDGVGFDTGMLLDDRKHVGLRNIRERLRVMVNGTLEIESTVGVGTNVVISIPKEV